MCISRRFSLLITVLIWLLASTTQVLYTLEPLWIRVLSGSIATRPVVQGDRVFALTDDRSVTCLDSSGGFLWSRPLRGRPVRYLSVASNGIVQALSGAGTLTCLSRDGVLLWNMEFNHEPICAPVRGKDGRTVFLFTDLAYCLNDTGTVLWRLSLKGKNVQHIAQSGSGHFLFYGNTGTVLLVSPFGRILTETDLTECPIRVESVPMGFVTAFSDNSVSFFEVRSGMKGYRIERLWTSQEDSPVVCLAEQKGTVYTSLQNGTVIARNITDASLLWMNSAGTRFSGSVHMDFSYSRITVLSSGVAVSFDEQGHRLWVHILPALSATGTLGMDGILYGAGSGWTLAAWQVEARVLSRKNSIKSQTYGILEVSFPGYAYMNAVDQLYSFLDRVEYALGEGTVGESEPLFARWLTDIVAGSFTDPFSEKRPDSTARGRAASLLGRLGSAEYRPVLLAAASGPFDESLAIGIIHGLSWFGVDPTGESVEAIQVLARRAGSNRPAVHYAACDALFMIARFSSGKVRDTAVQALTSFSADPWPEKVQTYARKALEALLQN